MVTRYAEHFATRTPQSRPMSNRQALNDAGGYAFPVDDWTRLDRFLVLGTEGGTYYQSEKALTVENARAVQRAIAEDGLRVVARIVEISDEGRAPKNDPALFALAMCVAASDEKVRQAAFKALPKVARIGTHLFHFAQYVEAFRGWGRGLRSAVARWYETMPTDKLALQIVKYQQRDGWSHRDLLRLAHPQADGPTRACLYDYVCHAAKLDRVPNGVGSLVMAVEALNAKEGDAGKVEDVAWAADLIREFRIPREAVPTELLNRQEVWSALLQDMPLGAMVRNLGKMSSVGLFDGDTIALDRVLNALGDEAQIRRARLHPLAVLVAARTYGSGKGFRGSLEWPVSREIAAALDRAFYLGFKAVRPTDKRLMLALDVSGSMDGGSICGSSLTPREGASALALVTAVVERQHTIVGFCSHGEKAWRSDGSMSRWRGDGISPLDITSEMTLSQVTGYTRGLPFGGTDCALPMLYALENEVEIDAFVIYTDSETWAGGVHPVEALKAYRSKFGIPAKLVVVGMTASGFSIADPQDGGMLDVVGFDTAVPELIGDFIRG